MKIRKPTEDRPARFQQVVPDELPDAVAAESKKPTYETKQTIKGLKSLAKTLHEKTDLVVDEELLKEILVLQKQEIQDLAAYVGGGYIPPGVASIVGNSAMLQTMLTFFSQKWLSDPSNTRLAQLVTKLASDHSRLQLSAFEMTARTAKAIRVNNKNKAKEDPIAFLNSGLHDNMEASEMPDGVIQIDNRAKCCECKQHKARSEFYRDRSRRNGVSSRCKECLKATMNNKEKNGSEENNE